MSVMYAPPTMRNRMLFTAWVKPVQGKVRLYVSPQSLAEFYPVTEAEAEKCVGKDGYRVLTGPEVDVFLDGLKGVVSPPLAPAGGS